MRRVSVPAVAPLISERAAERLLRFLQPAPVVAVYDRKLQPLDGIRWPRGTSRIAFPGEVPMFDVADAGELQRW